MRTWRPPNDGGIQRLWEGIQRLWEVRMGENGYELSQDLLKIIFLPTKKMICTTGIRLKEKIKLQY